MRIPQIFVPERNLEDTVKEYLKIKKVHQDPNFTYTVSVLTIVSRTPEMHNLTYAELMNRLSRQKGPIIGDGDIKEEYLKRAIQASKKISDEEQEACVNVANFFKALKQVIADSVTDQADKDKYHEDITLTKKLYGERIKTDLFDAYVNEPHAAEKDVMNYVNMIIGLGSETIGPNKTWRFVDPLTRILKTIVIDEKFIDSVEERLGLRTREQKESFRNSIRKIYGWRISTNPGYDFMDNLELVKAVKDVKLESYIIGSGSLVGTLADKTDEENKQAYSRIIKTMLNEQGYCKICAEKTIEYFCTPR